MSPFYPWQWDGAIPTLRRLTRDFLSSPDSLSLPRFHSPPHRSVSVAASSGASGEVDTSAPPTSAAAARTYSFPSQE